MGPRQSRRDIVGPLNDLGKAASARRLALNLTQLQLAELAGVGVSSVRAIEAGADTPSLAVAIKVLRTLGLGTEAIAPSRPGSEAIAPLRRSP